MTDSILSELELAALLCSRVCHDVISPVGAITNGLEVLEDDADEQMRGFAMDLIKKSAERASASLQFARIAYGAAGSAGAEIDLGELSSVALGFVNSEKMTLDWKSPNGALAKDVGRLVLNLIVIAQHAIPRGGRIEVTVGEDLARPTARLHCSGTGARIPTDSLELIAGTAPVSQVDARSIQPYFTGLLARHVGATLDLAEVDGDIVITMVHAGA